MRAERNEVLRYLGWRGQSVDDATERAVADALGLVTELAVPRSCVRKFRLDGMRLAGTGVELGGDSIRRHLEGCDTVYLFAATIGGAAEQRARALFSSDPLLAVALDAAATALVESLAADVENGIAEEEGRTIRPRFSCGYGDLPLSLQRDFLALLSAEKFAGVTATENFLLVPEKSVTALVGAGDALAGAEDCGRDCARCDKKECRYRL